MTFVPKQGSAVKRIEELIKKDEMGSLLNNVLKSNKIKADRISLEETEKGKGKEGEVFEGFSYSKYIGKLSGEKKKFLKREPFIARFELSLLKSRTRDGILVKNMGQHGTEDAKIVAKGFFNVLLDLSGQQGPVQWNNITRTGTF